MSAPDFAGQHRRLDELALTYDRIRQLAAIGDDLVVSCERWTSTRRATRCVALLRIDPCGGISPWTDHH